MEKLVECNCCQLSSEAVVFRKQASPAKFRHRIIVQIPSLQLHFEKQDIESTFRVANELAALCSVLGVSFLSEYDGGV